MEEGVTGRVNEHSASAAKAEDQQQEKDSDEEEEEEEEVGKLLRSTVDELESALQESRKLLAERDGELSAVRMEVDRYKQQAAKEIASKTKLAQALDDGHRQARELEALLQRWQLEMRESKLQGERLQAALRQEHATSASLRKMMEENTREKEELKERLTQTDATAAATQEKRAKSGAIDDMQFHFLKQAIFHLLTDTRGDDHVRAILSILDFTAQERKAVYAKLQEKSTRALAGRRMASNFI